MNEIIIDNIKVDNLKPTKKKFINKNKKFSAKGYYKDIKVKVYEVFDQNQGDLRAFISNHKYLSAYFPKLVTYNKKYIIEEWIDGKTLKQLNIKDLEDIKKSGKIQKIVELMWSVKYDKKVFDYIDHIHKRVNKNNTFNLSKIPNRINHNDLSLDNILITSNGLKIIDNEFLGCSSGWILNIRNSFINENYEYEKFVSEDILNKLWNIRKEWSDLIEKDEFIIKKYLYKIYSKIFFR